MSRERNVPLVLWISTAILAHIAMGGGAEQIARFIEERSDLQYSARAVLSRLHPSVLEVSFENEPPVAPDPATHPAQDPTQAAEKRKDEPKEHIAKAPEKKPEPVKVKLPVVAAPAPTAPPPPPVTDHRIAVKQHSAPDQEDNPTAHFIADEANHVKEESVAQITSHDQDDPNPTPGGRHSGPEGRPGNSEHDKIGESDEHPGDPTHAPGEAARKTDSLHAQKGTTEPIPGSPPQNPVRGTAPSRELAGAPRPAPAETPPVAPAPAPGSAGPAEQEVVASETGGYHLNPAREGATGASEKPGDGRARLPPPPVPSSPIGMLGLGGAPTPNGINLNLTPQAVVAVVGEDKLNRERMADGERRKSAHRGAWQSSNFEHWPAATENYVSSVKLGNQTALNAARSPFGTYLVTVHNRIHPIFAEDFLGSLDALPSNSPLNDQTIFTRLEIVLDRDDGHVIRMGVVKTSGITAFDIAALDSVQRASPFGKPPKAIVSPYGNVYFHWEFHRDPVFACSTINARPFIINSPPPSEPNQPQVPNPTFPRDPREQQGPPAPSRHGSFEQPVLRTRSPG